MASHSPEPTRPSGDFEPDERNLRYRVEKLREKTGDLADTLEKIEERLYEVRSGPGKPRI